MGWYTGVLRNAFLRVRFCRFFWNMFDRLPFIGGLQILRRANGLLEFPRQVGQPVLVRVVAAHRKRPPVGDGAESECAEPVEGPPDTLPLDPRLLKLVVCHLEL